MGKRYYCDYCDKSFPNSAENRKKHNEGAAHQAIKAQYYAAYKDIETVWNEEKDKKPCYRHLNSGSCAFGVLCRNSHRTPQELQRLRDFYIIEMHKKAVREEALRPRPRARTGGEQVKSKPKLLSAYLTREEEEILERALPKYELPTSLRKLAKSHALPPSLIPATRKDLVDFPTNTWA